MKHLNWSQIDLTRPTSELVSELKVSASTICQQRKRAGITVPRSPYRRSDKPAIDWQAVDLTRPAHELAAELQVSIGMVYHKRKKLAITVVRATRRLLKERKLTGIDWSKVDLTRPANDLVAEFKVTRQAISLARIRNGVINGVKGWRYSRAADSYDNYSNAF